MNSKRLWILLVSATVGLAATVYAAITPVLNFQGRLCDSSGEPLTTTHSVDFNLFNVDTGGATLYTETQSITPDSNGVYNALIGQSTPLTGVDFRDDLWIEVTVNGEVLSPRYRVTPSPYAFRASNVDWTGVDNVPAGFADGIDNTGGGSPVIEINDVVVDAAATNLDFKGGQFTLSSLPAGEANIELNPSSVTLLGAHIDASELPINGYNGVYMPIGSAINTPTVFNSSVTFNNIVHANGAFQVAIKTISANYTATALDHILLVNNAGLGTITVTLPDPTTCPGRQYVIKRITLSLGLIVIDPAGAATIEGSINFTLPGALVNLNSVTVVSDGTQWYALSSNL